ncbi:MAG: UMP kinase [Candidatus Altiarchaeota archaeon]|nr:UMP kinase [Candidatus Altiarchaeota archaeon]
MRIVFSVGGSLVVPDEIDDVFIEKFCALIGELRLRHRIAIVVGGGRLARRYIAAAENFQASDETRDLLGIEATHLNAMLVAAALGRIAAYRRVVKPSDLKSDLIVVTGGTTPGHSTDAVAAGIAVSMKADLLVNASNIKGVFDKDPSRNPKAVMIGRMTAERLLGIVSKLPQTPGKYALIDRLAVETIKKHRVRTVILNGGDIENLRNAVDGRPFVGTIVEG